MVIPKGFSIFSGKVPEGIFFIISNQTIMLGGFLSGSDAGIERLTITSHKLLDCSDSPLSTFTCQVNPEGLSYEFGVEDVGTGGGKENGEMGSPGGSAPPEGFKMYNKMDLKFEFWADATGILPIPDDLKSYFEADGGGGGFSLGSLLGGGAPPSIRKYLNLLQTTVYGYEPEIHGPPFLKFVWGNIFPDTSNKKGEDNPAVYKGTLKSCKVDIKLFSLKGEPVKAKITLDTKSAIAPEQRPLGNSPDLTHYYDITHGEKMTTYCNRIYGRYDSKICAAVAEYNGMVDWELPAGKKMTFPSIHLLEANYLDKYEDAEMKFVKDESDDEFMRDLIGSRRTEQFYKTLKANKHYEA